MAVTQESEDGNVELKDDVIKQIVSNTISEIDGVRLVEANEFSKTVRLLRKSRYPGVKVQVKDSVEIIIDLQLKIKYGLNLPDVAKTVQDKVKKIVKKTASITPKRVNIHIVGVERG